MAARGNVDARILALCVKVTAKRPRTVIDEILKNGFVTTEELQAIGYDHPPRAAKDVRDNGIPLDTFKVRSDRTGRMIAAYRFADPSKIKHGRIGGRVAFSKRFREMLLERYKSRDAITGLQMDGRYLQIDHRIPYEVAGDENTSEDRPEDFMLLDASSQRAKSWSCEHCVNWRELSRPDVCRQCYWAFPESYTHIAMSPLRRVDVVWKDDEVAEFDRHSRKAKEKGQSFADYLKLLLKGS